MTNTRHITTNDLMDLWNVSGGYLAIYTPDGAFSITSIDLNNSGVTVTTTNDTYMIPRSDKSMKMWNVRTDA